MKDKKFEWLTDEICTEYQRRAKNLPENGGQDTGAWRELRVELQERCNLTTLEAINILRGFHVKEYLRKYGVLSGMIPAPEQKMKKQKASKTDIKKMSEEELEEYVEWNRHLEEIAGMADDEET